MGVRPDIIRNAVRAGSRSGLRPVPIQIVLVLVYICVFSLSVWPALAQGAAATDISIIRKPVADTFDRVRMRDAPIDPSLAQKNPEKADMCLLPPLSLVHTPTVATTSLQIPAKARKEYADGCAALKDKKIENAEEYLRKAVQEYPKYSAAWVTLGQVLASQQRTGEARSACSQASTVDSSYVPAYLCVADIAAREKAWDEVLKLSGHALELDPTQNAVAYEYHAAANLNSHNLAEAEKSGLRAVEIDKDHREPRVHFLLAQIYEAKGDSENEGAQLREYLKYANSPDDVVLVKQYLSELEKHVGKGDAIQRPSASSSTGRWGPADVDENVPPVRTDAICPLTELLKETSKRAEDLVGDLQRFSAIERIEQTDIGKNGKRRNSAAQVVNYVAQIEQNSSGYPQVKEYRAGTNGIPQTSVVDTGTAAFALIFHPTHLGDFNFRCEGLSEVRGSPAWQLHFEESADSNKAFQELRIGGSLYLPRVKGRAWIATDSYAILRIETDLVSPIPQIDLQLEHLVIVYVPVEFQNRHVRLWLPESASVYIALRGHRYERIHNFRQFQLFSVDSAQAIKEPIASQEEQ